MVRYYGYYSNVSRGKRKKAVTEDAVPCILDKKLYTEDGEVKRKSINAQYKDLIESMYRD